MKRMTHFGLMGAASFVNGMIKAPADIQRGTATGKHETPHVDTPSDKNNAETALAIADPTVVATDLIS